MSHDHFCTAHDHNNSRARECLMEEIPDVCEIGNANVGEKSVPIDHVDKTNRDALFMRISNLSRKGR